MKTLAVLAIVLGVTMKLGAAPLLSDIVTFEALVIEENSAQVVATGGPWLWQDLSIQMLDGLEAGPGKTVVVKCRNGEGKTIFGAIMTGVDLSVPWSPFFPPDPSGQVFLLFSIENNTVSVMLNGLYYMGEMLLVPAEDDPVTPPVQTVVVDIKPGSGTNPFSLKAKGLLPVAIMGASGVDVRLIDPSSVRLAGVRPLRQSIDDLQADGYADLVCHFPDQDIAALLTDVVDGEVVGLQLTGRFLDGSEITGTDSITVIMKPENPRGRSSR